LKQGLMLMLGKTNIYKHHSIYVHIVMITKWRQS